ncbi:MAG TPA: DUF488 domain-containing protein [Geminicoccaceae bacterium]|nr:DUF488 domain-containing protein [Geminicoccaceae bacterium]
MTPPFFTIGHSTRSLPEFIGLLRDAGVQVLVDVRTVPRSRTNPQFNADTLPGELAHLGIEYRHVAALGGLRSRRRDAPASPNTFWQHASFRNYADYAAGEAFRAGLQIVRSLGHRRRVAIMCAEAVWWRCHRRIIADYLIAAGETVFHILGPGKIEPAHLNPAARRTPQGTLVYPEADSSGSSPDRG